MSESGNAGDRAPEVGVRVTVDVRVGVEGAAPTADAQVEPAAPQSPLAPVSDSERVHEIDVVRGFALLGILLMNIEWYTRPFVELFLGLDRSMAALDYAAGWTVMTLVQGKFYTLFSMLFGMGFAIQAERAAAKGARFGRLFARRMLGLALIGAAHGYLVWSGDILLVYSIVGSALVLLFRKTPISRLPKWAAAFILLVGLAPWGWVASQKAGLDDPERAVAASERQATQLAEFRRQAEEAREAYAHGTWIEQVPIRAREMASQLSFLPVFGWNVLGMFLLGAWLVRSGVMRRPAEHRVFFRRALRVGLVVGLPLAVAAMELGAADGMTRMEWSLAVGASLMLVASFALCFAYLSGFVLWTQRPGWSARLRPVAQAGRMALTNYLAQSLVATTLFNSWGFGLYGQVSRAAQMPLTLAIWLLNMGFSVWWLGRYRFGPAEWLWRSITYGRAQPMRRPAAAVPRPA